MAKSKKPSSRRDPAVLASDRLVAALNRQIGSEMQASLQYLAIASYFAAENLPQLAAFFYRQSDEERAHALKFARFVVDVGGRVAVPALAAVASSFASAEQAVGLSLEWERTVTDQIYALVEIAKEDRNHIAVRFLDWFVDEQLEEITTMDGLLALVRRAGTQLLLVEDHLLRSPLGESAAPEE